MHKPVRLKDIARALNVSTSLVSAVLNGKSGPWVSEQTRQRIIETAREMSYRPQAAARMLRSGTTHTVALLYWRHEYVRIEGLAQALSDAGYRLHVYVVSREEEFESLLQDLVYSRSADAFVLWGSERRMERFGEYLQQQGVRFAVKGRHERCHPEWYQVDFDHEGMMRASVHHLWRLGHRRIAYLGYPPEEIYRQHLLQGFIDTVTSLSGQAPDNEMVFCGVNSIEDAERQMEAWLNLPPEQQPTAVVITADNEGWYGAERALARHGKFIGEQPGDFGVSGQCQPGLRLALGTAHAHQNIDLNALGAILAKQVVLPLLTNSEPAHRVIRYLPEMTEVETQALRGLVTPIAHASAKKVS